MFFVKYIINYLKRYYKIEHGPEFVESLRLINKDSEVSVPNELIPAGVLMQLRGLLNLHTLSINNDWVWPYWMERQFNPQSPSFIPRAMSLSYINLTHRNWTATGVLGGTREAVVDPRGAVMPWVQGWSMDTWLRVGNEWYFPSRMKPGLVQQKLRENLPFIITEIQAADVLLTTEAWTFREGEMDYVVLETTLERRTNSSSTLPKAPSESEENAAGKLPTDDGNGAVHHEAERFQHEDRKDTELGADEVELVFSLRPCNGEGISLIRSLAYNTRGFWNIEGDLAAYFPQRPTRTFASTHFTGDVSLYLDEKCDDTSVHCEVGLATGANVFREKVLHGQKITRYAVMPMEKMNPRFFEFPRFEPGELEKAKSKALEGWKAKLREGVQIELPDPRYVDCFKANKAFLLMLNDGHEITAGPFTYHRHWFRDASYMLNALDKMGFAAEVAHNLEFFPLKQWKNGYFCSQKGEWDSNGQAIWAIVEHYRLTGDAAALRKLYPAIRRGVLWIEKKRHDVSFPKGKPRGLLPAGFSAEHLGPNDFYYWDNFWSLRGVLDAVFAAEELGFMQDHKVFEDIAKRYMKDLQVAMNRDIEHSKARVLPAAPHRRPDAGMIGNIAAAYPLKLFKPEETPWLNNTIDFIRDHLFHDDGFYQQMIHSGVNSYLTLQMAQCMLLMGDVGAYKLIDYMLSLATPTFCWPEAINPRTLGGCMGDGHHGWAASDWLLLMRNLVIHEHDDVLQVTRLLPAEWCRPGQKVAIYNAPTNFGLVSAAVEFENGFEVLTVHAQWRKAPREIHWFLPAEGRRIVGPASGVRLEGRLAIVESNIPRVKVEVPLEQIPAKDDAEIPGLSEIEQEATAE